MSKQPRPTEKPDQGSPVVRGPKGDSVHSELESTGAVETPATNADVQSSLLHPAHQVYFRAGLIACREYMARFVEAESPTIAMSIRANWWPRLGTDYGPPRQLDFAEVTAGEFDTPEFRCLTADEVSPTLEALPIALAFLQAPGEAPSGDAPSGAVAIDEPREPSAEDLRAEIAALRAERDRLTKANAGLHRVLADAHCVIDPERHEALHERIVDYLADCENATCREWDAAEAEQERNVVAEDQPGEPSSPSISPSPITREQP